MSEWTNAGVWIFGVSMFCSGLLWGGILWKIVPFPTWETIQRYLSRRKVRRS